MSESGPIRAIIVSIPGPMQESLRANLEALPELEVVALAGGCLSALSLVREKQPDVVVIDSYLSDDEVFAFIDDIREHHKKTRLVILTQTARQQRRIQEADANAVLFRWSPAEEFSKAVLDAV